MNRIALFVLLLHTLATSGITQDIENAPAANLTVMSFNMRHDFKERDPANNWVHRKELVAKVLNTHRPDLIGSQELAPHQVSELEKLVPAYRSFGVGRKDDLSGEGMNVFYNPAVLKPLATETFWLSETPDVPGSRSWGEGWIRCLTWAKFYHIKTKQTFYFFNTHLDTKGENIRLKESEFIMQRIKAIAGDSPLFLVADFNSEGGKSPTWKAYKSDGFKDAWEAVKNPKGSFSTWCGYRPPRKKKVKRIDWILHKGPIQVNEYETINYNKEGRYPSDHFPVMANVTIQKDVTVHGE